MLAIARRRILYHAALLLVPFLWKAVIDNSFWLSVFNGRKVLSFSLLLDCLGALFTKVLFKNDGISCVALVHCIRDIANERNEADEEVDDDIDKHHHAQTRWKSTVDLFAFSHDHQGKCGVSSISDAIEGQFVSSGVL